MSFLAAVLFVTLVYCGWEFFMAGTYELTVFSLLGACAVALWLP